MLMTNISDQPVTISISHGPRTPPTVIVVQPGQSADFPDGYCKPIPGAGAHKLPSVISQKTRQHGMARLVPADEAKAERARWLAVTGQRPQGGTIPAPANRRAQESAAAAAVAPAQDFDPDDPDEFDAMQPQTEAEPAKRGRRRKAKAD